MDDHSRQARIARAAPLLPLAIGAAAFFAERDELVSAPVAIAATAIAAAIALWVIASTAADARSMVERERRQLSERLERVTDRDPLTGVYNAHRLDEELRRQLAFAQRYGSQIAVLAIDLDGFEWISEEYGHATSDELLIASAEVLVDELRSTDLVTRRPPQGFVVVIPQTDEHAARIVAGKLIRRLRAIERARPGGASIKLRASVGVALSDPKGLDLAERLLLRADEALAVAQKAGGDRLALPEDSPSEGQRVN